MTAKTKIYHDNILIETMLTPEQQDILKTKWLDWYIQNTREVLKKHPTNKKNQILLENLLNLKW